MSVQLIGVIGMLVLLCLIFMRIPVAICMGLVGFFGYAAIDGWHRAAAVLGSTPFDISSGYALSVVPLFVLDDDGELVGARIVGARHAGSPFARARLVDVELVRRAD